MNWRRIAKHAVFTAVIAVPLYWVILQVFGEGSEPATAQTYIIVALACAFGGALGEIWRERSRPN